MAFIDGVSVAFGEAVQRCADLIDASAQPVFAHLGVDIAAASEAVRIAELTGGVLDHVASDSLLRDLDPLRETGGLVTTPLEADVRADVLVLIGNIENDPALSWLTRPARPHGQPVERRVIKLDGRADSLRALALLRSSLKRRGSDHSEMAGALRAAHFGVATWRAADLPALAVEAIHGLVRDLNESTRFSTLALPAPENGCGVQAVCGWMTGYPLRVGFGQGWPEHDPWRYDARRIIASGETDCVIWISSWPGGVAPPDSVDILLDDGSAVLTPPPSVRFIASSTDPRGIMYDSRIGTLVASPDGPPGAAVTTLAAIRSRLETKPC